MHRLSRVLLIVLILSVLPSKASNNTDIDAATDAGAEQHTGFGSRTVQPRVSLGGESESESGSNSERRPLVRPASRTRHAGFRLAAPVALDGSYAGSTPHRELLEAGQARPAALAAADFDEDGMPDLVSGYGATPDGGLLTLQRGNVDALFPNDPAARKRKAEGTFTDAPFL